MTTPPSGTYPEFTPFAKGVNSGYVPLGGVVISDAIARTFDDRVFPGGLTYSGHPLAAASAVATIEAMADERIVEHAARMGTDVLGPRLREIAERHAVVGEVRGRGVFWAVELVADRETREPLGADRMAALKKDLLDQGLLGFFAENRLHVVPPAVVTESELDRGLTVIDAALGRLG